MLTLLGDVALTESLKCTYRPNTPYIFNLEYVLGNTNGLVKQYNKINLASEVFNADELFGKKPIAVSVANNHAFDYGQEGFNLTVSNLEQLSVGAIGSRPYYLENGTCILAYSMLDENKNTGDFYFDRNRVLEDIKSARKIKKDGCLIVLVHWGIENDAVENDDQIATAHWMIDNGIDLVIGHHPHCIQRIEQYKGKYIFYSLGNALFGNMNQYSHFDNCNVPHRKYRIRWQKWNRQSLAVVYNDDEKKVEKVTVLYQNRQGLVSEVPLKALRFYKNKWSCLHGIQYRLRKYYLFFVSNVFTDGKLFDMSAVIEELRN